VGGKRNECADIVVKSGFDVMKGACELGMWYTEKYYLDKG